MKVSAKSPKNNFRASIIYSKALRGIGSVSNALGMSINEVIKESEFYTSQATKNNASSLVVIYENKKEYPDFDWQEIERFSVNDKKERKEPKAKVLISCFPEHVQTIKEFAKKLNENK